MHNQHNTLFKPSSSDENFFQHGNNTDKLLKIIKSLPVTYTNLPTNLPNLPTNLPT